MIGHHTVLQRQFKAYCTKVLKYSAISYYHANRRRRNKEVSLSSLLEKDLNEVSTTRQYPSMLFHFQVRECLMEVQNEPLGNAIEYLTPYRREIILPSIRLLESDLSAKKLWEHFSMSLTNRSNGRIITHGLSIDMFRNFCVNLLDQNNFITKKILCLAKCTNILKLKFKIFFSLTFTI